VTQVRTLVLMSLGSMNLNGKDLPFVCRVVWQVKKPDLGVLSSL